MLFFPINVWWPMTNTILRADLNVQNGLLTGPITFQPGLNFISGENGTLKTKLLQFLRSAGVPPIHTGQPASTPLRRQAFSPRRNAQRRSFHQIIDQLRRENVQLDGLINEKDINDASYENYPSLGDLFYVVYNYLSRDGEKPPKHYMASAAAQFNAVIVQVFPNYRLHAEWIDGSPSISIAKNNMAPIPLEGLSLGEQEILSLAANIYSSRDRYDVFLVDEPEVHLNWHLEEQLFRFFDDFCRTHKKQMIVVTHSRAIFKPEMLARAQFLAWTEEGKVVVTKTITPEQRRRIAGEAIDIIRLDAISRPTYFVEDRRHVLIVSAIAEKVGAAVSVVECGTKANVRSLFQLARIDGEGTQSVFIEDGDNEGAPFSAENFIHLDKYCLENYLIDFQILGELSKKSVADIQEMLRESIFDKRSKIFSRNKFFEFLAASVKASDITEVNLSKLDASEIIDDVAASCTADFGVYVERYVDRAMQTGRLRDVFPAALIDSLHKATAAAAVPA
jgi:energy-coupling factor transporter ATP-binding protein EcfA2